MWVLAAVALISIGGVICSESTKCYLHLHRECNPSDLPQHFPRSIEEVDQACSALQELAQCSEGILRDCGEDEGRIIYVSEVAQFLESACDPDSRIYKVVSSNFECLESTMPKVIGTCHNHEHRQSVEEAFHERVINKGYDMEEVTGCLNSMWIHACAAVVVNDECGEEAADAAVDIFINLDYDLSQCQEDVIEDLKELISAVMDIEYVEEQVENAIRKKKK